MEEHKETSSFAKHATLEKMIIHKTIRVTHNMEIIITVLQNVEINMHDHFP